MQVVCLNPGSSSTKVSVVDGDSTISHASIPAGTTELDLGTLLPNGISAAVVRVVHGGHEFQDPVLIQGDVRSRLDQLSWMAPLHNPAALGLIDRVQKSRPDLPVVACFDTAFHATLPEEAWTYPVPGTWSRKWGLRRFGFHGLSHAYASRRADALLGRLPSRLVSCHLGAGASLCAIREGRSIDTTMGFTPMDGLMMATRSGSVDPGLILFALRQGLSADDIERALDRESGLLGVSGVGAGYLEVAAAADLGIRPAQLALAIYRHRLVQGIAAMAASLGGIEALVFTGGVGENQPRLWERTCAGLKFLGIALDGTEVAVGEQDQRLRTSDSSVAVLVIHAREDVEMARQASLLLTAE
ncbi:MAG: acetate/propionate family kinase [Candidatus Dormibacteria bacterium]